MVTCLMLICRNFELREQTLVIHLYNFFLQWTQSHHLITAAIFKTEGWSKPSVRLVDIVTIQTSSTWLPLHANQSAQLCACGSCLIDALIQWLSTAMLWSLPNANTAHKSATSSFLKERVEQDWQNIYEVWIKEERCTPMSCRPLA